MAEIVRDMTRDYITEFSGSQSKFVTPKILQATQLIKQLIAYGRVSKTPLKSSKTPLEAQKDTDVREERQRKRGKLLEMGMLAFEQVYEIAQSEEKAKAAKYRVQAYLVLSSLGKLNAAILRDATDEELLTLMLELDDKNARLEAMAMSTRLFNDGKRSSGDFHPRE
jgi:hypothetical protein